MTLNATASPAGTDLQTLSTPPLPATSIQSDDTLPVPEYSVPRFLPFTAPSRKAASSKSPRTRTASHLETLAAWHLQAAQIPKPEREMRFHPDRRSSRASAVRQAVDRGLLTPAKAQSFLAALPNYAEEVAATIQPLLAGTMRQLPAETP